MDLKDRGKTFEDKYQHDTLQDFKIRARRNKKVGLWATKLLGVPPAKAEKFIESIVENATKDPDDSVLILRIKDELEENFITMTENQIKKQIGYFYQEAKMEVANENNG